MKTRKAKKVSFFTRFGIVKLASLILLSTLIVGAAYISGTKKAAREIDLEAEKSGGNVISAVGTTINEYGQQETIRVPHRSK